MILTALRSFSLSKHFAEIGVGGAALELSVRAIAVVGVDDVLADIAAAGDGALGAGAASRACPRPRRMVVEHAVAGPIAIAARRSCMGSQTETIWMSGTAQQGHHFPQSLRAGADVGEGDFVAWGDFPGSPRTWRGTMVKAAAPAAVPRKLRRFESPDIQPPESNGVRRKRAARSYDSRNTHAGPGGLVRRARSLW